MALSTTGIELINAIVRVTFGLLTMLSNFIEIVILKKRGEQRTKPEDLIFSLAYAYFISGTVNFIYGIISVTSGSQSVASTRDCRPITSPERFMLWFSLVITVLHTFLIAAERFYALRLPLEHHTLITKTTNKMIYFVWLVTLLIMTFLVVILHLTDISEQQALHFQGVLIFATGGAIIVVYAYLTNILCLFSRTKSTEQEDNNEINRRSFIVVAQKYETITCLGITLLYIFFSLTAAIICLLPNQDCLVIMIGEWIVEIHWMLSPMLYFCRRYLRRKDYHIQERHFAASLSAEILNSAFCIENNGVSIIAPIPSPKIPRQLSLQLSIVTLDNNNDSSELSLPIRTSSVSYSKNGSSRIIPPSPSPETPRQLAMRLHLDDGGIESAAHVRTSSLSQPKTSSTRIVTPSPSPETPRQLEMRLSFVPIDFQNDDLRDTISIPSPAISRKQPVAMQLSLTSVSVTSSRPTTPIPSPLLSRKNGIHS